MAKLTLTDLANLNNATTAVSTINANNALIEAALENTLSRDGTSPNTMTADLDMNSNQIVNLPAASDPTDPVRLGELETLLDGITGAVPAGGTAGQVLSKIDGTDYNTEWADASEASLDADLTAIAELTPSNDDIIQRKAGAWTNRTVAQYKSDLSLTKSDVGLGNVDNVQQQPIDADLTAIAALSPSNDDVIQRKAGAWTNRTMAQVKSDLAITSSDIASLPVTLVVAASDETTALTTGTAKVTFRMPHAMTLTGVRASLTTAQSSGNIFTVDINENGTTILSTKLTIDNNEKTSTTAAAAAVISDTSLADDSEITVDIDQVGASADAAGLKVYLIGTRTG